MDLTNSMDLINSTYPCLSRYPQITLDKEEVVRLLKLPAELQLALPFLHNPEQIYAHKILNHYTKMRGEGMGWGLELGLRLRGGSSS